MAIKAVLFDLDATLLPMDQAAFLKGYFGLLTQKVVSEGFEAKRFMKALMAGTDAMIVNDGSKTNEAVFWDVFRSYYTPDAPPPSLDIFDVFYAEDFPKTRAFCGYDARSRQVVDAVKAKGLTAVLATNPVFPEIATMTRMGYVHLKPSDFALYTTYENCTYAKPNLEYYRAIADKLGLDPTECLMVGNDVADDMVARRLGMQVFLLTDHLINPQNEDISGYPGGDFDALLAFVNAL